MAFSTKERLDGHDKCFVRGEVRAWDGENRIADTSTKRGLVEGCV
jgi:hypothetical protein